MPVSSRSPADSTGMKNKNKIIRPTERQPMRQWLIDRIYENKIEGLRWVDEKMGIFRIPWKHASGQAWTKSDAALYERWAEHTGT